MLESAGVDFRVRPYADRLERAGRADPTFFTAIQAGLHRPWLPERRSRLLERLRRKNKEGVVLKNLTAAYRPGKTSGSNDQLKYKFVEAPASWSPGSIRPNVASPWGCMPRARSLTQGNVTIPPNHDIPKAGTVVEVRYLYAFRQSGAIYQPCYLGEREDIEPAECTVSQLKYRHEPAATIRV